MVESIKFSAVIDAKSVSLLDTTVSLEGGALSTTLYTKPTDKNSILNASNTHPTYLKTGRPYTQFLRIKRIYTSRLISIRKQEKCTSNFH